MAVTTSMETAAAIKILHQGATPRISEIVATRKATIRAGNHHNFAAMDSAGRVSREIEKHRFEGAMKHNDAIEPSVTIIPVSSAAKKTVAITYAKRLRSILAGPSF